MAKATNLFGLFRSNHPPVGFTLVKSRIAGHMCISPSLVTMALTTFPPLFSPSDSMTLRLAFFNTGGADIPSLDKLGSHEPWIIT